MRFTDLPSGWAERPITDPHVFEGVVDLVVTEQSRREGAIYLLLTHPDGRMLQPLAIRQVPPGAPSVADAHDWQAFLGELAEHGTCSLVMVRARRGAPEPTPDDDVLFRVLLAGADAAGLEVHGRAIATPNGIRTLGPPGTDELSRPA
jgi:hypothetical protein